MNRDMTKSKSICMVCNKEIKGKVNTIRCGNKSFHYCTKHWKETSQYKRRRYFNPIF